MNKAKNIRKRTKKAWSMANVVRSWLFKRIMLNIVCRFVIKDLNEEQWYTRTYKGHKYPNFSSSTGYAKKYKCRLIAQIRAWRLGECEVQTYC
jgi:hypothetical protein